MSDEPALVEEVRALVRRSLGREPVAVEPLRGGGGLGHRPFLRVRLAGGEPHSLVARVDRGEPAPGVPPEPPLEPIRAFLERHGLPVPRRLGAAAGIDLLEDGGPDSLQTLAAHAPPARRAPLYAAAVALVPRLQGLTAAPEAVSAFGRRLDAALVAGKARRFAASALPALLDRPATAAETQAVHDAFASVAEAIADAPARLAHRDFQSANLLVRETADGPHLMMIDLQGAFLAPPEYDLVCLLRDSYVVLQDDEVRTHAEAVRETLPDAPDAETFWRRFDLLTITRKGKDLALFHEVAARGDRSWLRHAPATAAYLRSALARRAGLDPRLARLAAMLGAGEREDAACAR